MRSKAELSLLLDYYGGFLTERRRELMRMSADDDMSLSEIAEVAGVSRQSVRDAIAKGAEELALCEQRLGLIQRDRALRGVANGLAEAEQKESASELRQRVIEARQAIEALIK